MYTGPAPGAPAAYNSSNQVVGGSYDAAGNQILLGTSAVTYDAENRQTSVTDPPGIMAGTERYCYDGLGQRVKKSGPATATVYVYDALGQLAAEYSTASATAPCLTCYLSVDHLGSTRLVTDASHQVIGRHDFFPFGEEIGANSAGRNGTWGPNTDNVYQRFTGQERDQETGLDFLQARYYGAGPGRFLSPDPGNAGSDPANPQSWNGYGYVVNNPLVYVDPNGDSFWGVLGNIFSLGLKVLLGGGGGEHSGGINPTQIAIGAIGAGIQIGTHVGGSGGSSAPPGNNSPLPPGSFPGGENLGLPPGMKIPGLSPFGLSTPCDFGDCGTGLGPLDFDENHHIFSQQFRKWFEQHGIDIDAFIVSLERGIHRLKPNGIHTTLGGNWNTVWQKWIADHPNASPDEIMKQAKKMLVDFGIGGADTLPDMFIIVNPCVINPTLLPSCKGGSRAGTLTI